MTSDRASDQPGHGHRHPERADEVGSWDDALCRLEDVLLAAPYDRALPSLDELLVAADVPRSFLLVDERAHKLLGEAILARPFAERGQVQASRAHVEMMLLEVEVLAGRLRDPGTTSAEVARALARLDDIAAEVADLRRQL